MAKLVVSYVTALLLIASLSGGSQQHETTADGRREPGPAELIEAIEKGLHTPEIEFRLQVHCTDRHGARRLVIFPSGIAIWEGRAQIDLRGARSSFLETLLHHDFPSLEPRYGGRPEPEEPSAALRVSCRVALEIGELRKSSVQLADGDQSPALANLAAALLDLAEPLSGEGVFASDLDDGLRKLAEGALALESFRLRLVELPAGNGEGPGSILLIADGAASYRPYSPGRELGDPVDLEMPRSRLAQTVTALRDADIATLPVNLWSSSHLELEVAVLDHRKAVVARPFSRLTPDSLEETQERFDRLAVVLRELYPRLSR